MCSHQDSVRCRAVRIIIIYKRIALEPFSSYELVEGMDPPNSLNVLYCYRKWISIRLRFSISDF